MKLERKLIFQASMITFHVNLPNVYQFQSVGCENMVFDNGTLRKFNMLHFKMMVPFKASLELPGCHFQVKHVKLWEGKT